MFSQFLPKNLDDYVFHHDQIKLLKLYNKNNMPNLLLYGKKNSGKKTLIKNYIKYLFGINKIETSITEYKLRINNNEVKITLVQSLYYFEINLYEYGLYDKHVLCNFVKDLLMTKSVLNNLRILIINNLDKNTKFAQLALRRIMEKTCQTARIFILCDSVNKVDPAILSRCFQIRLPSPNKIQLKKYIIKISKELEIKYSKKYVETLVNNCDRDLFNLNTLILSKKKNFEIPVMVFIEKIWNELKKNDINFLGEIRINIYKLHLLNYSDPYVIKYFLKHITNQDIFNNTDLIKICSEAAIIEHNSHIGKKPFFNLEKLFIFVKRLLINKDI
jgi:replication factor C subunit 3/5